MILAFARDCEIEYPAPRRNRGERSTLRVLLKGLGYTVAALALSWGVCRAQQLPPPSGQAVLNQALAARLLTKSDTAKLSTVTRGLYIGDPLACQITVLFNFDTASVALNNVQPGAVYPFAIVQLFSTGTTCAAVTALY